MSNEKEVKELRGRLLQWQLFAERQIALGLMDEEQMPSCFQKGKNTLKEVVDDTKTIGSHCAVCGKAFGVGEAKVTDNHILFFHPEPCKEYYDKCGAKDHKIGSNG